MPNTGKPSKDCHLCRKRRVKCDLGRPGCQRCVKYGTECPGYRDQQELVFRNANQSTVKKRKKNVSANATPSASGRAASEASSSSSGSGSGSSSSSTAGASTPMIFFDDEFDTSFVMPDGSSFFMPDGSEFKPLTAAEQTSVVPQSINEHWTSHSIPILLNVYSTMDFIHNMYQSNTQDGPLLWAAHLFTRTYVTNLRFSSAVPKKVIAENDEELGGYLGKALASVSAALSTPGGAMRDDVLATVWILANYELLMGSISRLEPMSPWHLHAEGLYSILKTRGTKPLYTERGRAAFWPAYNMVQIHCLLSNIECPSESEEWLGTIRKVMGANEGVGLSVCMFITSVAHVQARILTMLRCRDFVAASREFNHLVGTMTQAKDQLDIWLETKAKVGQILDPYMKNMYSSTCVKGYHVLLLFCNFLTHHIASPIPLDMIRELRRSCIKIVRSSAQEVLDSLKVTLDPLTFKKDMSPKVLFDALKLVWPLTAVYVIQTVLPEQRAAAAKALQYIGRELGIRQALKAYPGGYPLPIEAEKPLDILGDDAERIPIVGGI
ncbi:hypothetical protein G7046_g1359 [Stylonectria norvegica]|nr:hypothetical protein G7046_g1359 [Stylonectria norvegica]